VGLEGECGPSGDFLAGAEESGLQGITGIVEEDEAA
jgi:hypothetical protein